MSIDLEAIRKKLNKIQNKTSKKNNIWKPEPGQTDIRIVPYNKNLKNPFIELFFHYQFNGRNFLSPKSNGNPDPIAEFAEELQKTGSKDDWKMGKNLEPKPRTYVPIVIRGKENEGVKYWGFGIQVYEELMSLMLDPEYGDITDIKNGTDITVDKKTPEEAGNSYGKITIRPKRKTSPITTDTNLLKKLLKEQQDINEIFPEPTYEVLKEELEKYMNPEEEVCEEDVIDANIPDKNKNSNNKNDNSVVVSDDDEDIDNILKDLESMTDED